MHSVHIIHIEPIGHKDTLRIAVKGIVNLKELDSAFAPMILPPDFGDV